MDFVVGFVIMEGAEAVVSKTVASPFERVRLLQQTIPANQKVERKDAFRTMRSTMQYVLREEGAKGFWRGNAIHCLTFYTKQAFRFGFHDEIKDFIPQYNSKLYPAAAVAAKTVSELILAGALVAVIHPLELCRTRLAADVVSTATHDAMTMTVKNLTHTYKGFVDCLQQVIEVGGIRGIYRGFLPATLGMFQFRQGAKFLSDLQRKDSQPWLQSLMNDPSSPSSVMIRKTVTMGQSLVMMVANLAFVYPLDSIARRMKIDNGELRPVLVPHNSSNGGNIDVATSSDMKLERVYRGMKDHMVQIMRYEGIGGLYRGFVAASIHTSVTFGMMTAFALFINPHLQAWYIKYRIAQKDEMDK